MDVYKSGFMLLPFWVVDMAGWCGVLELKQQENMQADRQPSPDRREQESKWNIIIRTTKRKKVIA